MTEKLDKPSCLCEAGSNNESSLALPTDSLKMNISCFFQPSLKQLAPKKPRVRLPARTVRTGAQYLDETWPGDRTLFPCPWNPKWYLSESGHLYSRQTRRPRDQLFCTRGNCALFFKVVAINNGCLAVVGASHDTHQDHGPPTFANIPTNPAGTVPCGRRACICCGEIKRGSTLATNSPTALAPSFKLNQGTTFTCDDRCVIYSIECGCHRQYVGETSNSLRTRARNHRCSTAIDDDGESSDGSKEAVLMEHKRTCAGWSGRKFCVLQKATATDNIYKLENTWIIRLGSLRPHGLNSVLNSI